MRRMSGTGLQFSFLGVRGRDAALPFMIPLGCCPELCIDWFARSNTRLPAKFNLKIKLHISRLQVIKVSKPKLAHVSSNALPTCTSMWLDHQRKIAWVVYIKQNRCCNVDAMIPNNVYTLTCMTYWRCCGLRHALRTKHIFLLCSLSLTR